MTKLREDLEAMLRSGHGVTPYDAQEFITTHAAEILAMAEDAERYRWLLDNEDPSGEIPYITWQSQNSWGNWVDALPSSSTEIDAAIDQARKGDK